MMNAAPKQAENVARGSFTPSSVPATFTNKLNSVLVYSYIQKAINVELLKLESVCTSAV